MHKIGNIIEKDGYFRVVCPDCGTIQKPHLDAVTWIENLNWKCSYCKVNFIITFRGGDR